MRRVLSTLTEVFALGCLSECQSSLPDECTSHTARKTQRRNPWLDTAVYLQEAHFWAFCTVAALLLFVFPLVSCYQAFGIISGKFLHSKYLAI